MKFAMVACSSIIAGAWRSGLFRQGSSGVPSAPRSSGTGNPKAKRRETLATDVSLTKWGSFGTVSQSIPKLRLRAELQGEERAPRRAGASECLFAGGRM